MGDLVRVGLLALVLGVLLACGSESSSPQEADGEAGSGADAPGDGDGPAAGAPDVLPCDVAEVVVNNCLRCHGDEPIGGAIKLVTHEDWHRASPLYDPDKMVYEVAQIRINNGEMPQGATMSESDLEVLDAWLEAGAAAGVEDDVECVAALPDPPVATGSPADRDADDSCNREGANDPIVPRDDETCYEFLTHGQSGVDDTSKFQVPQGESYHEIYYDVPWESTDLMTRFGGDLDNLEVLHHYLIFTSNNTRQVPGDVARNVPGTTLGTQATLIGGWAVGGCGQELPEDVGGELPASELVMIQWHMFNTTGAEAEDGSKLQICVVPEGSREHVAGVTFLGTENFGGFAGMPPGENHFTTRCRNDSGGPVTLMGFTPHMHLIGTNMKTEVERLDGTLETIFDKPFDFDYQVGYQLPERVVVEDGETLVTTCSYFNDTGSNVGFGESTDSEMCYNYVAYYPSGVLNKSAFSLIGALNTCW
ncbi:MAG: hypothetical protein OXT09_17645 [Myxococcales bacterium]|nr:hypothetical protein [Myxococcales bacterium]